MTLRVFSAAVCGIAGALVMSGCSTLLVKPAAGNVKTVALVSAYMNRDFYDVKEPRTSMNAESLAPLGRAVVKGTDVPGTIDDPAAANREAVIAHGIAAYADRLESVGGWKWLPAAGVVANSAYRTFADARAAEQPASRLLQAAVTLNEAGWHTAGTMTRIPLDGVANNDASIVIGSAQHSPEEMRQALAGLCRDLNVDAVAVIEFDMAYRKILFNLDFIGGIPAIPSVSAALVLVDRNGEIVVNSGLITKGQGRRFEGTTVSMLNRGTVRLNDASIAAYCRALDKSADDMKRRLTKALGKKK